MKPRKGKYEFWCCDGNGFLSTYHADNEGPIEADGPEEAFDIVLERGTGFESAPLSTLEGYQIHEVEAPSRGKVYLAGPMTGHPQFNFPLFDEAAKRLRARGYDVVSPAELDDPETRKAALSSPDGNPGSGTTNGETWGDFLSRDVKLVADEVDAVAVLPEWWTSKGARLEVFVANDVEKPVFNAVSLLLWPQGASQLTSATIESGVLGEKPSFALMTLDALRREWKIPTYSDWFFGHNPEPKGILGICKESSGVEPPSLKESLFKMFTRHDPPPFPTDYPAFFTQPAPPVVTTHEIKPDTVFGLDFGPTGTSMAAINIGPPDNGLGEIPKATDEELSPLVDEWPPEEMSAASRHAQGFDDPTARAQILGAGPEYTKKIEAEFDDQTKATNPKDAIGSDKLPMHLWPTTASVWGAMALLDGALKYGRANWREAGVRYSIYYDAAIRHLNAAMEGEDKDPDSGLPHEAHALACLAIIVDARAAGQLTDDRNYRGEGYRPTVEEATKLVPELKRKHAERDPKHYDRRDEIRNEVEGTEFAH